MSKETAEQEREGWGWPGAAAKPHYFVGAESLCRRWMFTGPLDADTGTVTAKDCTPCGRALARRRAPEDR